MHGGRLSVLAVAAVEGLPALVTQMGDLGRQGRRRDDVAGGQITPLFKAAADNPGEREETLPFHVGDGLAISQFAPPPPPQTLGLSAPYRRRIQAARLIAITPTRVSSMGLLVVTLTLWLTLTLTLWLATQTRC